MPMPSVLISGANRGLGLEFCRQYAISGWEVIACCRNPSKADDLSRLADCHSNVQIIALDVAQLDQIGQLSNALENRVIDVLINNAGVYDDKSGEGFGAIDYGKWLNSFTINTLAPDENGGSLIASN